MVCGSQTAQVGVPPIGFRRDAQLLTAADRWNRVQGFLLGPGGD
jgi:hypothetical protein